MPKAAIATAPLFVDASTARDASEHVLAALMRVRAARRWVCKAESKAGRAAHQDLHEAETKLDEALSSLGAVRAD